MDLGFDRAGYKTLWQCEIEKHPRSILERHWPDTTRYTDVASMKGGKIAPVDVISFGSPCQDLSVAGKRSGLTGSRSGLFHQAIRVITEMRKATNNEFPKAVVWENVPGALSSSKGNDFATVIDELAKSGAVDIQWSVLDAQHFGVPQRRRRVFVVAIYSRTVSAGEIFAEPASSPGDLDAGHQTRQAATSCTPAGARANSASQTIHVNTSKSQPIALAWSHEVSPCVSAKWAKGTGGPAGDEHQNLLVYVQSLPVVTFVKTKRAHSNKDDEAWASGRPAPTLNAMDNGSESRATVLTVSGGSQYSVRRLTPRECERLQGWPDDHTRWTAEGKELTDSPRYKACGNGVASPVAEYVARRLAAVLEPQGDA